MARNKFDVDEKLEVEFNIKHFKRLFGYLKPYRLQVYLVMFLMIAASVASMLGPYLTKVAIDEKIPNGDIRGLLVLAGIFLGTLIINSLCLKYKIRTMSDVGQKVIYKIREDLFVHLQKLPFSYYDSRPHGKILVRVVNYVNSLDNLLSNGLINVVTDLFSLIVIVGFMLAINIKLTFICLIGLPILIFAIFLIKNLQRKAWQVLSSKRSNMNAYIHESIAGMKVTQSFVREDENLKIFREVNDAYRSAWFKAVRNNFLLWPTVQVISVLVVSAVYIVGITWIGNGITVGVLVAFMGYIGRFWAPISNLGNFYNTIIETMAYLERIFETMDEEVLVRDTKEAATMPNIKGNVEFRNVCFEYEKDNPILKDVNLIAKEGETIAIVGPTGAGKTTIINLISRFYNLTSGKVLIDGIDISTVTLNSLRSQMGIMLQDTFIFSGTIIDNIRYSKLDATDEEVMAAAKAVKAHDFIIEMEKGYNTEVNERGTRLSVGQRQLISFARALLADPRILILDEATSSIDTETEKALQEGLNRLLRGRTSFVIAHRLSTIKNASKIIYIDSGRIIEEGSHDELIKERGAYWKLYTSQNSFLQAM
ncbi:MAG: ABC transporter ATP-binding protein [Epulopiscium sp.]|nr:ABC transporter ATP-binding protein [Candidatus Epulonipiscium sp.]